MFWGGLALLPRPLHGSSRAGTRHRLLTKHFTAPDKFLDPKVPCVKFWRQVLCLEAPGLVLCVCRVSYTQDECTQSICLFLCKHAGRVLTHRTSARSQFARFLCKHAGRVHTYRTSARSQFAIFCAYSQDECIHTGQVHAVNLLDFVGHVCTHRGRCPTKARRLTACTRPLCMQ